MSSIVSLIRPDLEIRTQYHVSWVEERIQEIINHAAWHNHIDTEKVEALLAGKPSLSFILRATKEDPFSFVISYINDKGEIINQPFFLKTDQKLWWCLNASTHRAATIGELIPKMMHCEAHVCNPIAVEK